MTQRLDREDPYLLEFDARVVERASHQGRPAVVLDRTAFYPEGGGQAWDTGTLDGVAVVAVVEEGGRVLHVLAAPLAADQVHGRVDGERRRDHRQQHHGQHLLSRALVEAAGARTLSVHLGAGESTIDLDREPSDAQLAAAAARANQVVWEARPVRVRNVSPDEARALGIEPPAHAGEAVRLVDAEGFDLQPCGGTHPRSTSEVGVILVLGQARYKGGARIRFICGYRALAAAAAQGAVLERLSAVLSAPAADLVDAACRRLEQLAALERRNAELLEQALEGEARRLLAAQGGPVVTAIYDGWPAADLRSLAGHLVGLAPCVALLGSRAEKASLVFAQSPGLGHDIPTLLRDALSAIGGRGGGRGDLAQGGGDRPEQLEEALARAAAALRAWASERPRLAP